VQTTSVVFDFDGTVIDSKPGIIRCLKSVSEIYGLDGGCINDAVIGPPAEETIKRLMPNHGSEVRGDFLKAFRESYALHGWSDCSLYPGIMDLLEDLRDSGARIFICTSKREDLTLRLLYHFKLRSYFQAVVADRDDLPSHDKRDLLAGLIEAEGIDVSSSFMIGDSKYDMDAARANGLNTIGVLYGYGSHEELVASKPDALCEAPRAIYQFLESIGALG
jgi:phosphoglycolate phosphatase